jgi:electron-transferring-flavoprotein dehydrogenase
MHTMGWPLGKNAGGGSFIYHLDNNQVYVGFVVHLNYENPYLYPYMEFQRFKHHPMVAELLKGGKRIAYGARAIAEGGLAVDAQGGRAGRGDPRLRRGPRQRAAHQGQPQRDALGHRRRPRPRRGDPGGPFGRRAGGLRPLRSTGRSDRAATSSRCATSSRSGRNTGSWRASSLAGSTCGSTACSAGTFFGTMSHGKSDAEATGKAKDFKPIDYPKPDGVLSFDRLTNVSFSMTNHEEKPARAPDAEGRDVPISVNLPEYAEPAQRYCPAGVYEVVRRRARSRAS